MRLVPGDHDPVELPFTGLDSVADVAIDAAGDVHVVDAQCGQVLKLATGADKAAILPFNGLIHPVSVAGDVYVVDAATHRVVELKGA
jgi:hypothetical protein